MSFVLGVDFGTGGVRVGAFDRDQGRVVHTSERAYVTNFPRPGWAEQSAEDWWEAFVSAVQDVLKHLGVTEVDALSVSTTASTVVVTNEAGQPLRPAILWMDARATEESRATAEISHQVLSYSGGSDAVEWLVPKAMWLSKHEPDTYREAAYIVEAIDFINHRLTCEWHGSQLNATCKWNYDTVQNAFHPDLFEAFGVPDLHTKLPQSIIPVGQVVSTVTPETAAALGFTNKPLVVQGGIDAHMAMLSGGTLEEGDFLVIGGTSTVLLTLAQSGRPIEGVWGPYPHALLKDKWLIEAGQVSTGSILSWLTRTIFGLSAEGERSLIQEAEGLKPDQTGLLTLDYWMGNRTPYRDADLRGAILGLSLGHDRASIYRSAVDAIALGALNIVKVIESQGISVNKVVVAGGIRNNAAWLRATVDALGKPVYMTRDPNLTPLAGAIACLHGLQQYDSLRSASDAVVQYSDIIEPDREAHNVYQEQLAFYRQATEVLTPVLHKLARG